MEKTTAFSLTPDIISTIEKTKMRIMIRMMLKDPQLKWTHSLVHEAPNMVVQVHYHTIRGHHEKRISNQSQTHQPRRPNQHLGLSLERSEET